MAARNMVIAGDYEDYNVVNAFLDGLMLKKSTFTTVSRIKLDTSTVASYEVINEAQIKSFASGATRGLLGGVLLGGVGALAGVASAKNVGTFIIALNFKDGKKSLVEVDQEIYKAILTNCFSKGSAPVPEEKPAPAAAPQPAVSVADELLKFKQLLDMGAISQQDFDNMKNKLMGDMAQPAEAHNEPVKDPLDTIIALIEAKKFDEAQKLLNQQNIENWVQLGEQEVKKLDSIFKARNSAIQETGDINQYFEQHPDESIIYKHFIDIESRLNARMSSGKMNPARPIEKFIKDTDIQFNNVTSWLRSLIKVSKTVDEAVLVLNIQKTKTIRPKPCDEAIQYLLSTKALYEDYLNSSRDLWGIVVRNLFNPGFPKKIVEICEAWVHLYSTTYKFW